MNTSNNPICINPIPLIVEKIFRGQSQLIDSVMKRELPENIYRWAHSGIPYGQKKAALYLEKHRYHIERCPTMIRVMKGEKVLDVFMYPVIGPKKEPVYRFV